ncbi:plasmid recombination protein [Seohaeicola saemankumensis]|uniref:plasmid recombination protein n=1 Tax=Seohaeicola saemankumensis TaxID=481181 RepID=UPI001E2FE068|nr:plasmid recombination protein [Seohaeicola saemankumensis]MCD1628247.1 plasmid recombination protein [Seohaeicola saemankumensis]
MDGSVFTKKYAVVLRFAGLHPRNLKRLEMHAKRAGGDLGQCDPVKMKLQKIAKPLIGDDWVIKTLSKVQEMRLSNFADELDALQKRNRQKDIQRRMIEGPHDPWRATAHGPMRELILTVNRDWFDADTAAIFDEGDENNQRIQDFQRLSLAWLKHEFGDDVVYARADHDEAAFHIHAVILPRVDVEMTRTDKKTGEKKVIATRKMLQPSKFEIIQDYEKAQDSVGDWFAPLNLVRGERRKEEFRQAMKNKTVPPPKRQHVHTAPWRKQEEIRLARMAAELEQKRAVVDAKEDDADAIIAYAEQVASGEIEVEVAPEIVASSAPSRTAAAPVPPRGFERARRAFQAALGRLRKREQLEAETAADARVSGALSEIKNADQAIVNIAALLPAGLRERVAHARKSLTAKIMLLDRFRPEQKTPRTPSARPESDPEQ